MGGGHQAIVDGARLARVASGSARLVRADPPSVTHEETSTMLTFSARRLATCAVLLTALMQAASAAEILIGDGKAQPESLTVARFDPDAALIEEGAMAHIDWVQLCETALLDSCDRLCVIGVINRFPVPALPIAVHQLM